MTITVALIAAVAENGVIGADGNLPWRLSADLRRFKRLTLGKPVILGRTTFEGLPVRLEGRDVIVVSRQPGYRPHGVAAVATGIEEAIDAGRRIAAASGAAEVMVGGGAAIYRAAMPFADRLYVTHVAASPAGDATFPPIPPDLWRQVADEAFPAGPKDTAATRFAIYERQAGHAGGAASPAH